MGAVQFALIFYGLLFRKTVREVYWEISMGRSFVFMMILHVLSLPEIDLVKLLFADDLDPGSIRADRDADAREGFMP